MALGDDWEYEPTAMSYYVPRQYTPDFVNGSLVVEAKGYFREGDTQKYRAINAECKDLGLTFVMVLMNPDKKVRKGATLNMSGWCEKNGIPWFTVETLSKLKEMVDDDQE